MYTLLLRLAAPLQAWGTDSKFDIRRTDREPSKSGVTGLLAAALGRRRDADLSDLGALRFGVRTDREGRLIRDFHMVHKDEKTSYVTTRFYLSDAVFLVGLEGESSFLETVDEALHEPKYPLFLGRRSCPPTLPLTLGIRPCGLEEALMHEPPLTKGFHTAQLPILVEPTDPENGTGRRNDLAISFDPAERLYAYRPIRYAGIADASSGQAEHDPFSALDDPDSDTTEGGSDGFIAI